MSSKMMRKLKQKFVGLGIFCLIGICAIGAIVDTSGLLHSKKSSKMKTAVTDISTRQLFISPTCIPPRLKLNHSDLAKFFHPIAPLSCSITDPGWLKVINATVYLLRANVNCDIKEFWRRNDNRNLLKFIKNVRNGTKLHSDFFEALCFDRITNKNFRNVYATIVRNDFEQDAGRIISRFRNDSIAEPLNVYMFGFDSISRLIAARKLPKLLKFLREELGAVVLEGYNIVGDGTPQALIPILTGKTEPELPLTRKRYKNASYVNVYPFIWNNFSDAGYVTLYGEDAASTGTFTYRLKGFDKQPTDHYMRTFYKVVEKTYYSGNCIGPEPQHLVHFRYVEDFFTAYPDRPKFAFQFHSIYSHDDLNKVSWTDEYMVQHLRKFKDNGWANNTVFIAMSDHGPRFANFRQTQQGKLEERLAFMTIAMPPWFKAKHTKAFENLKANSKRLTTPFDLHPTLHDILEQSFDSSHPIRKRGISLFDGIPATRTCTEAGIEPHWCTCLHWENLAVDANITKRIAEALLQKINNETAAERARCAELRLKRISLMQRLVAQKEMQMFKKTTDYDGFEPDLSESPSNSTDDIYQIMLETVPGNAIYEASVTVVSETQQVIVDLNAVSHVNRYGDLPHCVINENYFLAKWCVCYDKIH